jgi:hypothetical protein
LIAPSDILTTGPGAASVGASHSSYTTVKASAGATVTGGAGNIAGYPGFTNPAAADFTLDPSSPLLDGGDPTQGAPR